MVITTCQPVPGIGYHPAMNGDEPRPSVGAAVKALREERGLSLRKLARSVGTQHGHLSQIESGKIGRPGAALMENIARELGVTVEEIDRVARHLESSLVAFGGAGEQEIRVFAALLDAIEGVGEDRRREILFLVDRDAHGTKAEAVADTGLTLLTMARRIVAALDEAAPGWHTASQEQVSDLIKRALEVGWRLKHLPISERAVLADWGDGIP